jgi:endonuclease/exonuclease/phosphatase family metal-dependent hydrolase
MAEYTPRTTRPMAALDFEQDGHRIRIIAVHWTAPFDDESNRSQEKLGQALQHHTYAFLHDPKPDSTAARYVIVMGDFNNEPYEIMESHFQTTRSRTRSKAPPHFSDDDAARVRLYNCAWRLLGERVPHDGSRNVEVAGSYALQDRSWKTPDQILVSGSLLFQQPPFLAEDSVAIYVNDELIDESSHPRPFIWRGGSASGFSDHLPVSARIVL